MLTKDTDIVQTGEYLARNNTYNRAYANGEPYTQTIRIYKAVDWSGVFDWSWPVGLGEIKAYPEIIVGRCPWLENTSTVKWLPEQIAYLPSIVAEFDFSLSASADSRLDATFDIWFTATQEATRESVMCEIMILVDRVAFPVNPATKAGTFDVDGVAYDLHISKPGWDLFAFYCSKTLNTEALNINKFVDILIANRYITGDLYLASIEFGNEIINGIGKTTINNYRVSKLS